MSLPKQVREWLIPLHEDQQTLAEAYAQMKAIALQQESIPLLVQLVENPKYDLPGIDIFSGATDLATHDYIHILLGRGVLPKDEAFVIGFTMGSTKQVGEWEEKLYGLFTKHFYPKNYRFSDEDFQIYKDAVRLGYISNCQPLNKVDYPSLAHLSIKEARGKIGIEADLLRAYYKIEARRYPESYESQRLIRSYP
ncbi:hypothetical protein GCM10011613_11150 [Cellvibrio zantedeschiae]|uniref:Uncharacterized protein n=1 Tax=Cellvibrio zantedeschiae TaxID=1237077 RepID=A0ABQ3AVJ8_9GAMM|nr:hypothetical protein [Cellvibrio zantedeschiae]GGY68664.1 hypothetical protein GCM10011613_11150 [Cellvibrio zantedeschiae]